MELVSCHLTKSGTRRQVLVKLSNMKFKKTPSVVHELLHATGERIEITNLIGSFFANSLRTNLKRHFVIPDITKGETSTPLRKYVPEYVSRLLRIFTRIFFVATIE
jgi:hypothetical protein